ncbi:hypothetical protein MUBE_12015 [Mycobacterium uberis]|uniref:Transmembrane protein n=1 Tax=Mycobacterium uberis TaxID=2162698 RepID=A0A3E1HEI1_9MYCO|nr:hypothetical protein [Mycobacterium uberis]RFD24862.1 hypothetical protein MUBE_12015 [Mycobacterium uberis]
MLIIALVLALIGLVALVFAVVTSNELVAWVCIGISVLGVVLLIVDAVREHQRINAANDQDQQDMDWEDKDAEVPDEGGKDGDIGSDELLEQANTDMGEESVVIADKHGDDRAT